MWSLNRWLIGPLAAGAVFACGSSDDDDAVDECDVTAVSIAASVTSIDLDQTSSLTATVTDNGFCGGGVTWSVSPEAATLTPDGLTASFVSGTTGTYTVTATSSDDASVSGSIDLTVAAACPEPNGDVVVHNQNIAADETWAGDGTVHSVPSTIRINSATVTIEACAVVSMGPGRSIVVVGDPAGTPARLVAAGTSPARSVSFVRAEASQPWGALQGYNASSSIELHHAQVVGGGDLLGSYRNAAIQLSGSAYGDLPVGLLEVDHVTIDAPLGAGVYFDSNAAFTDDSTDLVVRGAADHPLVVTAMALGSIPPGTYTGNAIEEILVHSQFHIFADLTIRKRLPIRIQVATMSIAGAVNDTTPVTLTLEPGVEFRFQPLNVEPGAHMTFGGNGSEPNNKVGVLIAEGTAEEPIVFTSGAETPAPGDWQGIWLDTANGSRLDHVVIEYAGSYNGISSANCRPDGVSDQAALVIGDFADQYIPPADLITNSVIRFSAGSAINAIWVGDAFGPDLTQNGNTLSGIAECGQTYNGLPGGCGGQSGCY